MLPGTYSNGKVTYTTSGTEEEVEFTINYKVDGVTKTVTTKVEGLGDKYKVDAVQLSDLKTNASSNYGGVVTNYTANDLEWKLFYADSSTNRVYLIASDYVPKAKLPTGSSKAGLTTTETYNGYWSSAPTSQISSIQTTPDNILTLFKATGYTLNSSYANSKCVSTMLNHNNWTDFVDTTWADYATGGPTIEMWTGAWNDMYDDKLYCNKTGTYGYNVGTSSSPTTISINSDTMKVKTGYSNKLFYPHTAIESNCGGYRLASPSMYGGDGVMLVYYGGAVCGTRYGDEGCGFRPVVSLNSTVKVKKNDNGTYTLQ